MGQDLGGQTAYPNNTRLGNPGAAVGGGSGQPGFNGEPLPTTPVVGGTNVATAPGVGMAAPQSPGMAYGQPSPPIYTPPPGGMQPQNPQGNQSVPGGVRMPPIQPTKPPTYAPPVAPPTQSQGLAPASDEAKKKGMQPGVMPTQGQGLYKQPPISMKPPAQTPPVYQKPQLA